jgi:hypothetical protein
MMPPRCTRLRRTVARRGPDPPCQAVTLDQLHAEEVPTAVLTDLVNGHDVRVVQPGRRFRLQPKTLHLGGRGQLRRQDHLEGDDAVQADLPRPVNHAHPAARDLFLQLVVAEAAEVGVGRGSTGLGAVKGRLAGAGAAGVFAADGPGEPGRVKVWETVPVVFRSRLLPATAAMKHVQQHQFPQQHRLLLRLRSRQEVLKARRGAGPPGGLEPVAHLVQASG